MLETVVKYEAQNGISSDWRKWICNTKLVNGNHILSKQNFYEIIYEFVEIHIFLCLDLEFYLYFHMH